MVVGDRATGGHYRLGRSPFNLLMGFQFSPTLAESREGEVGSGAVGVDVGESSGDRPPAAGMVHSVLDRFPYRCVQLGPLVPGNGGFQSVFNQA